MTTDIRRSMKGEILVTCPTCRRDTPTGCFVGGGTLSIAHMELTCPKGHGFETSFFWPPDKLPEGWR